MIIIGVVLNDKKEIKQPEKPLPEKERTVEDAIRDLSVPVSIPQNGEDISEVVESISNPTPINKENSVSDDDIKNAIEGLSEPVKINK